MAHAEDQYAHDPIYPTTSDKGPRAQKKTGAVFSHDPFLAPWRRASGSASILPLLQGWPPLTMPRLPGRPSIFRTTSQGVRESGFRPETVTPQTFKGPPHCFDCLSRGGWRNPKQLQGRQTRIACADPALSDRGTRSSRRTVLIGCQAEYEHGREVNSDPQPNAEARTREVFS